MKALVLMAVLLGMRGESMFGNMSDVFAEVMDQKGENTLAFVPNFDHHRLCIGETCDSSVTCEAGWTVRGNEVFCPATVRVRK